MREMQIKTKTRYYLTPVRRVIIEKTRNNKMLEKVWRKGNPHNTAGGTVNWCSHYGKQYGDSSKNYK